MEQKVLTVEDSPWLAAGSLQSLIDENNGLISIFVKSINTAKQKDKKPS